MTEISCGAIKCDNNKNGMCGADKIRVNRVRKKPLASCKSFSAKKLSESEVVERHSAPRGILDQL